MGEVNEMNDTFTKKLIKLFKDKTGCDIQHGRCPCNSCFHGIWGVDFQHITWLIVLGLRGDYNEKDVISSIKRELEGD